MVIHGWFIDLMTRGLKNKNAAPIKLDNTFEHWKY